MRVSYDQFVDELINESGQDAVSVRRVLLAMSKTLNILPEGATVMTPLGFYKVVRVKGRLVKTPSGQVGRVPDCLEVRLVSNKRHRRRILANESVIPG